MSEQEVVESNRWKQERMERINNNPAAKIRAKGAGGLIILIFASTTTILFTAELGAQYSHNTTDAGHQPGSDQQQVWRVVPVGRKGPTGYHIDVNTITCHPKDEEDGPDDHLV